MTENQDNNDDPDLTGDLPASPERPIKTSKQDDLDRSRFVRRICAALINRKTKKATGVVIGVTGPWGSGKSSILNLAHEYLFAEYKDAVVVRFDPWLVSGRDELIGQFFAEFVGTLNKDKRLGEKTRKLAEKITAYGAHVAPLGNLLKPGVGSMVSSVLKCIKKFIKPDEGLFSRRSRLFKDLNDIDVPIVVFIDELDRVEDKEIRSIAQLVRSIVDFPNVSYLLAFDVDRVAEALGDGDKGRGQGYLEKIVQFQIPLPITFDDELRGLLETEIGKLSNKLSLPKDGQSAKGFEKLIGVLIPSLIQTPRDVKRLVGVFHVLAEMVGNEVEWVDVLGLAALQIKAPDVVNRIRVNPDWVVENPLDRVESMTLRHMDKMSHEKKLSRVLGKKDVGHRNDAEYDALSKILAHLFPFLDDNHSARDIRPDRICMRRPLLTALRLGLIPGVVSKDSIIEFFSLDRANMEKFLKRELAEDRFGSFYDRLSDVYLSSSVVNHEDFWHAVGAFLKKPDSNWLSEYSPMPEIARNFTLLFEGAITHGENFKDQAKDVFMSLQGDGDITLTANLLRSHMWQYGLFGCEERGETTAFFDKKQAEEEVSRASAKYRDAHLAGNWIAGCWNLQPVFIMKDTGNWDDACKKHMDHLISDNDGLDGFTLMLFGGIYSSEKSDIEKIVSYEDYIDWLRKRLADQSDQAPHETVCVAIKKALGETQWN